MNNRYFPWAAFIPRLLPPAKPRFLLLRTIFVLGYFSCRSDASLFVDALSTIITSILSLTGIDSINSHVSLKPL